MRPADVDKLGLKPLEQLRFTKAVHALRGEQPKPQPDAPDPADGGEEVPADAEEEQEEQEEQQEEGEQQQQEQPTARPHTAPARRSGSHNA